MRFLIVGAAMSAALLGGAVYATTAKADGLTWLHAQAHIGGKLCFPDHDHTGHGTSGSRESAAAAAARHWEQFTALEYGAAWGSYPNAHDQRMSCDPSGSGWSCTAVAKPCRAGGAPIMAHAPRARRHAYAPVPVRHVVRRPAHARTHAHVPAVAHHPHHSHHASRPLVWPGDR